MRGQLPVFRSRACELSRLLPAPLLPTRMRAMCPRSRARAPREKMGGVTTAMPPARTRSRAATTSPCVPRRPRSGHRISRLAPPTGNSLLRVGCRAPPTANNSPRTGCSTPSTGYSSPRSGRGVSSSDNGSPPTCNKLLAESFTSSPAWLQSSPNWKQRAVNRLPCAANWLQPAAN